MEGFQHDSQALHLRCAGVWNTCRRQGIFRALIQKAMKRGVPPTPTVKAGKSIKLAHCGCCRFDIGSSAKRDGSRMSHVATEEPHVYRRSRGGRVFFVGVGAVLAFIGVFFITAPVWCYFADIVPRGPLSAFAFTTVLGCLGLSLGSVMVISTLTGQIDLYADAIEVRSALPFGNRRLERKDIAAKLTMFIYVPTYVLYPRRKDQKKLTVSVMGTEDDYYREWMAGIPDADREFFRSRRTGKL